MRDIFVKEDANIAQKTMSLAVRVSLCLAMLKLAAFFLSNSILVLVSAFDSCADAATSVVNRFVNRKSLEQADKEHPFGHGGFEVIGSLIQGLIILFIGMWLLLEACDRFINPLELELNQSDWLISAAVLLFSAGCGYFIHRYMQRNLLLLEQKGQRSLALLGDHAHYAGDAFMNAAGATGVITVYLTQQPILDPIMGCIGSLLLMLTAFPVLRKVYKDIMQNEARPELQRAILAIVTSYDQRIKGVHLFRTRELGPALYIDFHLELEPSLSLVEAHNLGQSVSELIRAKFPNADVLVHLDPHPRPGAAAN